MNTIDRPAVCAISIHAPHEGGDHALFYLPDNRGISIHAPHEGGDGALMERERVYFISIHAPHEGGDFAGASSDGL